MIRTISRYTRLYLCFIRFSLSSSMMFRFDLLFRILMDLMFYVTIIIYFKILYLHTSTLGGWTPEQGLIFAIGFMFIDAIHMTVFGNGIWSLHDDVNKGSLDFHLVRPVSTLFLTTLREFSPASFLNLLITAGLFWWAFTQSSMSYSVFQIALYIALLINGAFLYYLLRVLVVLVVFWTHSAGGLQETFFSLTVLEEMPHRIFPNWVRYALLSVVPFGIMASIPAEALFHGVTLLTLLHVFGVTSLFFIGTLFLWKKALRSYASASS